MRRSSSLVIALMTLGLTILACTRSMAGNIQLDEPTSVANPTPSLTPLPTAKPTAPPTATPIPAVRITHGDEALFYGDWDLAIQEFQNAQESSQDSQIQAAALLGIGRAYLYSGNMYQANEHFERLIAEYPDTPQSVQAHFFLGKYFELQQNYSFAAESYRTYLEKSPGTIDAYVWDMRGDMLFASGDYLGAVDSFQSALDNDSPLDQTLLNMKLARAYALSGDHPTALALYDDLYYRSNNHYTRALIDLRKGQILTELGQIEQAHEAYFDAVYNYPTSYDSYTALIALIEAGEQVHELNRGLVDYYAGQYGAAAEAFNRYLQNAPEDPAAAYYYLGLCSRSLGNNEDAISWWDKLISEYGEHRFWDEAWEQKAYTQWAFMNDNLLAITTLLSFAEQAPAHPRAAEFIFDAALASERAENLAQAIDLWKRVINVYPDDERAAQSLFLAGITHYRLGEYDQAISTFQRNLTIATTLEDRAAAYLWIGKAQLPLGDVEAARQSWEDAASTDPTGYYSERARDILHGKAPFVPPEEYDILFDADDEKARAESWMTDTFQLPAETDFRGLGTLSTHPNLVRGTELWHLGLYDQARVEFEQLRQSVESDPLKTYQLTNYLIDIGAYRSGIMAARGVLNLAQMDDADTLSAPIYFNHLRFGTYFSDLVMPLAEEYDFHPLFIFSVIRQESLFDHSISSAAEARGLMQIIPSTGADIASNLGWPEDYSSEDLNRPFVNLRFGVDYLSTQYQRFDGNYYAALAAYNGGPGNAQAWLEMAPDDPDLFLELIRFKETRNYIRGVYELYTIYRYLYDRTP